MSSAPLTAWHRLPMSSIFKFQKVIFQKNPMHHLDQEHEIQLPRPSPMTAHSSSSNSFKAFNLKLNKQEPT